MRTTSSLESVNAQFKRMFKRHGNIFKFIESAKLHEYSKVIDLQQLQTTVTAKQMERRKNIDKERDEKIKHFSSMLDQKQIDVTEFLEAMANKSILPSTGLIFFSSNDLK